MKILFVCSGNVARSQEAAAFYNQLTDSCDAESAGTAAIDGKVLDPLVLQVMSEVGLDLMNAHRKSLTPEAIDNAETIISFVALDMIPMGALDGKRILYWEEPDPRGNSLDGHRQTRDAIKFRIEGLLAS